MTDKKHKDRGGCFSISGATLAVVVSCLIGLVKHDDVLFKLGRRTASNVGDVGSVVVRKIDEASDTIIRGSNEATTASKSRVDWDTTREAGKFAIQHGDKIRDGTEYLRDRLSTKEKNGVVRIVSGQKPFVSSDEQVELSEIDPSPAIRLASKKYHEGFYAEAIAAALESINFTFINPDHLQDLPHTYSILAMGHFKLGEKKEAYEYHARLVRILDQEKYDGVEKYQRYLSDVERLFEE